MKAYVTLTLNNKMGVYPANNPDMFSPWEFPAVESQIASLRRKRAYVITDVSTWAGMTDDERSGFGKLILANLDDSSNKPSEADEVEFLTPEECVRLYPDAAIIGSSSLLSRFEEYITTLYVLHTSILTKSENTVSCPVMPIIAKAQVTNSHTSEGVLYTMYTCLAYGEPTPLGAVMQHQPV